ncbi:hypothetical protein L1987_52933 [Smallanthus sonchifolius]|uniref:Uncharacterized protein n=1 Tax=Smallanthus sonchifolius TaxID=185202 RepID=A0ACB9ETV6_9ASTR|nr:hypothetical protein L1987_52933 [Smallanthus sonchifolius]
MPLFNNGVTKKPDVLTILPTLTVALIKESIVLQFMVVKWSTEEQHQLEEGLSKWGNRIYKSDGMQRLAHYFSAGLEARMAGSGTLLEQVLTTVAMVGLVVHFVCGQLGLAAIVIVASPSIPTNCRNAKCCQSGKKVLGCSSMSNTNTIMYFNFFSKDERCSRLKICPILQKIGNAYVDDETANAGMFENFRSHTIISDENLKNNSVRVDLQFLVIGLSF